MRTVLALSIVVLGLGLLVRAQLFPDAVQALEARTRTQHEQLLEDTQSLADLNDSLVRENADRIADIAALKADLAALRAEIAALREARR